VSASAAPHLTLNLTNQHTPREQAAEGSDTMQEVDVSLTPHETDDALVNMIAERKKHKTKLVVLAYPRGKTLGEFSTFVQEHSCWASYLVALSNPPLLFFHNGGQLDSSTSLGALCQGFGRSVPLKLTFVTHTTQPPASVTSAASQPLAAAPTSASTSAAAAASAASSSSASTFSSAYTRPAKDAAEEALRTAVSRDGRLLHDVPPDHYCLYSSLLHAFTTQLPPVHQAHMDAREHMLTTKPAHSFLAAIASSMEANDLLETVWELDGLERVDIPTLEKSIVEKAEPADFKRGEGSTVASLLNKMRSQVTKPWGTELILTYFIPSMYDVGVRVLHVDKDGSRADCSEYTLPV
jgi:hypothetical protein